MSIENYLSSSTEEERVQSLRSMRSDGQGINLELAEALIQLPISDLEKYEVIETVAPDCGLTWELFLVDGILNWPQNIAARLIKLWAEKTSRIYHPLLSFQNIKSEITQRIFYTIVDLVSPYVGGRFYESYSSSKAIPEYSPALHGLMMIRGVQFNVFSENILAIAKKYLDSGLNNKYADSKGFLEAILYYARFAPDVLNTAARGTNCDPWNSILNSVAFYAKNFEKHNIELETQLANAGNFEDFNHLWPILPFRYKMTVGSIESGIRFVCSNDALAADNTKVFDIFSGCDSKSIREALVNVNKSYQGSPENMQNIFEGLLGLTGYYENNYSSDVVNKIFNEKASSHIEIFKNKISEDSLKLLENLKNKPTFETAQNFLTGKKTDLIDPISFYKNISTQDYQYTPELFWAITRLYSPELKKSLTEPKSKYLYWQLLIDGIESQSKEDLEKLTIEARKQPFLVNLCFLRTLGLYEGNNEAALRLMDYVRSTNDLEISEVIQSFSGINTPRSLQELISCITRPNLGESARLEACRLLQDREMDGLQPEIKAALADLDGKKDRNESWFEIRDLLKSLLITKVENKSGSLISPEKPAVDLDEKLTEKIPNYQDLSSEVKRALRTGQFFYDQVSGPMSADNIEISPIIDMVYKSLELQFRESFEDLTMTLVKEGVLQRKLDIIGYARPIPKQMDEFEDYISKFDTIKEIPFFSKFKLRKMLRALCQYKPGKRFTLDGIKAFALFFLCFSRSSCQYGLAGLLDLGMKSDQELYTFVKDLHILQDFRNRAVHEGFRPEARNDIEGIWATAGDIYSRVFTMTDYIREKQKTGKTAG